jgi:hypothetical protein
MNAQDLNLFPVTRKHHSVESALQSYSGLF